MLLALLRWLKPSVILERPVFMSIMRGYDGLLIGALFGVLLIIAVRFMMYVTQWFQAREVDHE